jgi:hydrogenase maturation protein HypF
MEIDFRPAIAAITRDVLHSKPTAVIASAFHNTIAASIVEVCGRLRSEQMISKVCLSGGAFQNWYLLERTVPSLRSAGFEVYLHSHVPPNDGGISLGQAVIASEILQHGAKTCV